MTKDSRFWVKVEEDVWGEPRGILYNLPFPPRMSWQTAKELAVEKWKVIEKFTRTKRVIVENSEDGCALCQRAKRDAGSQWSNTCRYCIVFKVTEKTGCEGTPYCDYEDAFCKGDVDVAIAAAGAEVTFIEKLEVK